MSTVARACAPSLFAAALIALLALGFASGCASREVVKAVPEERAATEEVVSAKTAESSTEAKLQETPVDGAQSVADSSSDNPFGEDPFAGDEQEVASDPLEPVNRGIFWFNDKLYFYVMKPTVKAYRFLVHEEVRKGVSNFFSNLASPVYIVNDLLQLRGMDAGREGFRFLVNSTLGVFGIFDIAKNYGGLSRNAEDMGQTLGSYGMGHGFYIVLPVLGPSSLRDGVGTLTDFTFHPVTYAGYDTVEQGEIKAAELTTDLSLDKDTYETVVRQSLDPYVTIRNGYFQYRRAQVEK